MQPHESRLKVTQTCFQNILLHRQGPAWWWMAVSLGRKPCPGGATNLHGKDSLVTHKARSELGHSLGARVSRVGEYKSVFPDDPDAHLIGRAFYPKSKPHLVSSIRFKTSTTSPRCMKAP